jgi:phosphate uptake regulator
MQKRIFKFGAGSWAIVVPKPWVDKNKLDGKAQVDVHEDEYGNVVISANAIGPSESEVLIGKSVDAEALGRWVVIFYRQGVKRLKVYSREGGATKQFEAVEEFVDRLCPGFEVSDRSAKVIEFEDLNDMREISTDKLLHRLRSLIAEELEEIGRQDSSEIGKLEGLVNRFFSLGIRYINITQGRDATKNFKIFQLLETVSDQLYLLSKQAGASKNRPIFDQLKGDLQLCFEGLVGDHNAIEKCVKTKDLIIKSAAKTKGVTSLEYYLIGEVAKNIMKVSELGLPVLQKELDIM